VVSLEFLVMRMSFSHGGVGDVRRSKREERGAETVIRMPRKLQTTRDVMAMPGGICAT
jgi:hypothetical protein